MAARKKGKGKSTSKRASAAAKGPMANAIEVGHQIWLAGLGALVRAQREGPKLFESLVEEGGSVEENQRANAQRLVKGLRKTVDARAAEIRGKAGETLENLEAIFQSRVQKALQQLGMPTSKEINALSRKVNELNQSVHALTRSRSGQRANKSAQQAAPAADETAVI
jgi:poly(hydroxyalkanoate) granule-associated protein